MKLALPSSFATRSLITVGIALCTAYAPAAYTADNDNTNSDNSNTAKTVTVNKITPTGIGEAIGQIKFSQSKDGLVLTPSLKGLSPGLHGIHIHQNASCDAGLKDGKPEAGHAAGGHFDPHTTKKHEGPTGSGHHGDLPALLVNKDGTADKAITAPRLTLADVQNRTVIIHEGGDNYSDLPKPLGGGGGRIACGIIQ